MVILDIVISDHSNYGFPCCLMPSSKFPYNLTFSLEGEIIRIVSKWQQWWPFRIFDLNDFSTSQYPFFPDASKQVLVEPEI